MIRFDQFAAPRELARAQRINRIKTQNVHFLLDKLQTAVNGHGGLAFILLQQDWSDKLVDICIFVEGGEFSLDTLVFLLLRFEFLTCLD